MMVYVIVWRILPEVSGMGFPDWLSACGVVENLATPSLPFPNVSHQIAIEQNPCRMKSAVHTIDSPWMTSRHFGEVSQQILVRSPTGYLCWIEWKGNKSWPASLLAIWEELAMDPRKSWSYTDRGVSIRLAPGYGSDTDCLRRAGSIEACFRDNLHHMGDHIWW